jgi:hypothetical protein
MQFSQVAQHSQVAHFAFPLDFTQAYLRYPRFPITAGNVYVRRFAAHQRKAKRRTQKLPRLAAKQLFSSRVGKANIPVLVNNHDAIGSPRGDASEGRLTELFFLSHLQKL